MLDILSVAQGTRKKINYINYNIKFLMFDVLLGCGGNVVFDLGFALDGSNSIDSNEYRLTKDFIQDIIRSFSISEEGTHVALLEYASEAYVQNDFDEYYDVNELLKFVEGLKQTKGGATNIGRGLKKTLDMFSDKYGMRESDEVSRHLQSSAS